MQAYLAGKRTIDDRALNRRVLERFETALTSEAEERAEPVRIVELGAGVGTMIARLASWNQLPAHVTYRAVDRNEASIAYARKHLPDWLEAAGYTVSTAQQTDFVATRGERRLEISLEVADAFSLTDEADAVVAMALLDIVALETAIPAIARLLDSERGGLVYAPITFNGATTFAPPHPDDALIERLYHRHMDEIREKPGSARAGSTLLTTLANAGWDVLDAGGADWIVRPSSGDDSDGGVDDEYPGEEAHVLRHLLETIDGALADYPDTVLEPAVRRAWYEQRLEALEQATLVFVAHNLDVLARYGREQ